MGIVAGSYAGGRLGGSAKEHYDRYWMAFITQVVALARSLRSPVTAVLARGSARPWLSHSVLAHIAS